ncbi:hypothetical protein [Mycolicibacterium sp. HS_4_1]
MFTSTVRRIVGMALMVGSIVAAIAAAPIASADKADDLFRCTDNGGTMKDCCAKGGGDYVKHPNGTEVCTFDETGTRIARNPDGRLQVVAGEGNPSSLPPRATYAPLPPGITNVN